MNRLTVAGLGPGSPEYITPAAVRAIAESDIVVGGTRNLAAIDSMPGLDLSGIERYDLTGRLDETREFILAYLDKKRITVVASGDPGFYGILGYIRRFLDADQINVIPGISSVQYMFAKLGMPWESARFGSFHGRDMNPGEIVSGGCTAFLTDKREGVASFASRLCSLGLGRRRMYAGCMLSYPEEEMHSGMVEDFTDMDIDTGLCVVVVADE